MALRRLITKGKKVAGILDKDVLTEMLYETSYSARGAYNQLKHISNMLKVKEHVPRLETKKGELEQGYKNAQKKYVDSMDISDSELTDYERKLKRREFDNVGKALGKVAEIESMIEDSQNTALYAARIERYLVHREIIDNYEESSEKIENSEVVNKSPRLRGKIMELNKSISQINSLEHDIFANNLDLLSLLPVEYTEKFRSTPQKGNM